MNILILFSQPWRVGGAETHVEALLKGLADHKLFLTVNEGSQPDKLLQLQEKFPNVRIITIQARGANVFRWRQDIKMLCELVKNQQIDVISAQQRTAGIWAHLIQRAVQVPYTVTMHDPWHRAMFKSFYGKLFKTMFVVSQNLAKELREKFNFSPEQIHLINNGIDFKAFAPLDQQACLHKLGLATDMKMILHVSRLSNVKGAVALSVIESMKHVLVTRPEAKLIIIGEGPMRKEINEKITAFNEQYGDKISIYDFVNNITDWYNATDVLVGEGRVAMETLACKKPIVAIRNAQTFIGAITMKNISYACDVNFDGKDQLVTADSMAKEIDKAFQLASSESEQIADYSKQRLSLENMANAYLDVFTKIKSEVNDEKNINY